MNLEDLAPKRAHFDMKLNGRKTRLFLRPFTLRDRVWQLENWNEKDLIIKFFEMDIKTIAKVIWHMMEANSKKKIFAVPVVFKDFDEKGNEITVEPEGYERFIALAGSDPQPISDALRAFYECRGLNDAIVKNELQKASGIKKK